jgi:PAS domain S-box-containing protein
VIDDILARLARDETVIDYEVRLRAKDGGIRYGLLTCNVYRQAGRFVHTRGVTRDITARKHAEQSMRATQRQIDSITDALPTLVSFIHADGTYRYVNRAYERWFGLAREEMVGTQVREVLGDAAYERVAPYFDEALKGHTVTYRARVPYRLGGDREIEATYIPQRSSSGRVEGFTALVHDVSEQAKLEQARALAAGRTRRLLAITSAIAEAVREDEVFEAVVDQAGAALGASSAGLWVTDEEGRARIRRSFGYSDEAKRVIDGLPVDGRFRMPVLDALANKTPIWIGSVPELIERYPNLAPVVSRGRSYRAVCMPVNATGSRALGALAFTFEGEGELGEDDRSFLELCARYCGQALDRLFLLEAEKQSRARAEAWAGKTALLAAASRAFAEAESDLDAVFAAVTRRVTESFADACAIFMRADEGEVLVPVAMHHREPEAEGAARAIIASSPVRLGHGANGIVAQTGKSLRVGSIDKDSYWEKTPVEYRDWLSRFPPKSLLVVPIKVHGRVIGTLSALRHEGRSVFSEEAQVVLEELGERAALAIESARLHADNRRSLERAEQLYALARAVLYADDIGDVFEAALDAVQRALGTDRASILISDADRVMRFVRWRGLSDEYRRAVEGHSPWSPGETDPKPIVVSDVAADPAMASYEPIFARESIAALGFIPLVAGGRLLGKFMVYYREPRALSSQELDLALAIANHVAAAVARFSATRELERTVRFNEMFTGILGHDLRNPLHAIMTAANVALLRSESERTSKPMQRILSSGNRMARMIDQLLDFTRVRVGAGIPLDVKPLDLVALVRQILEELEASHPNRPVKVEQAGDAHGTWDGDRLAQVFSNLLGNAVQHGPDGSRVDLRIDGTDPDRVCLTIHNDGVIPPEVLPRLFEPMSGREPRRARPHGLGLGLFITSQIVRAHGGTVSARSSEHEGTTFTVVLPRVHAAPGGEG